MVKHKRYWISLWSLLLILVISGCSRPEKEIVTVTEIIKPTIAIAPKPKELSLLPLYFYVITEENYDEFKLKFLDKESDLVYYALSVPDYENLALNMEEIKRYLVQQKEIIVYYEKAVTEEPEEKEENTDE
jgi:hypothetical protein|tara:strand:- start:5278 stop:5670 length:393 start_codon:yes stop_codon:yes gene_type:complete